MFRVINPGGAQRFADAFRDPGKTSALAAPMRGDRDEVEGLRPAAATAPVAPAISAVADVIASAGCERSIYLGPLALLLGLTALAGFPWTLKSGQYDDLDGAALPILPAADVAGAQ